MWGQGGKGHSGSALVWAWPPPLRSLQPGRRNRVLSESKSHSDPFPPTPPQPQVWQGLTEPKTRLACSWHFCSYYSQKEQLDEDHFRKKEKSICYLLFWVSVFMSKGDAASFVTLARHSNSGRPDRLNMNPLIIPAVLAFPPA